MSPKTVQCVAVKAIMVHNGKVLLLRKAVYERNAGKQGKWNNPGGKISIGEPWEVALRREVLEETGISDFTIGRPLYIGEWTPVVSGVPTQIICTFLLCTTPTTEVKLSYEHDLFVWIDPKEVGDYEILAPEDVVIEENTPEILAS